MTPEPDRDQALERLLRASAGPEDVPGGTGDHLDAETAAAWVERRLGPQEIAAIESHVSACDRCQELVAMIVRTTPVAPAADARPRWRLAWLVPIGATAAGLAIWFAVGQRAARTVFVEQTAEQSAAAPVEPVAPPDSLSESRPESRQESRRESRNDSRGDEPMPSASQAAAKERASADQAKPSDAAKPAEPQGRAPERLESLPKAEAKDASSATGAFSAPTAGAPASTAARARAAAETAPRATSSLPVASAQARSDALALSARNGVDVLSVDPAERWRFGGPGVMQHSLDAGRNWTIAPIASEVQITAGSSPAASICWLAGRAGVVMLTIDGQTWRRLPFPFAVDLVSISATDAQTATVTAADGRRFQTSDAGQTWR